MILNLILLVLVFGANKRKLGPYYAALLAGAAKAAIYLIVGAKISDAFIIGALYSGLAIIFVFFLRRLEARDFATREEIPVYRSPGTEKFTFKWEYIPLVILLFLLVGGELLIRAEAR